MNTILSLLLSLSALLFVFTPADAETESGTGSSSAPPPSEQTVNAEEAAEASASDAARFVSRGGPVQREGVDYEDITYFHYDPESFYDDTDLMCQLADEGDADGVVRLYDELYREFQLIDTLAVIAMLNHDGNIYDDYWTQENTYLSTLWSEAQDELLAACNYVMGTSCQRALSRHVGRDTSQLFRQYSPMDESDLDSYEREVELLDEYYAMYDTIDATTVDYMGESWDFDKLYGFPGDALYESDYDGYMTVYDGLQQKVSEEFAPLYIELVELWTQMARDAGYDSYTDYAYEMMYWRDYSPDDAQALCDAIKPIAREYYADLYYSDISYAADEVSPLPEGRGLAELLGEYLPRIDESLTEPWEYMLRHGLFDIQSSASGRFDGAYTTNMLFYLSPFIYATTEGSCQDLITITHEYGHFCDYYFSPLQDMLSEADDLDLSEIHSNALQALFTFFYDEIFETGADIAEYQNLSFLLENIIDGCFYDEFQRRIMDDPEGLTTDKINRVMTELAMEYGMYEEPRWDGTWAYIPHNFERPFYYFSYAASAIAALQIWDMAQTDFHAAVDVYLKVLSYGSHSEGYDRVLEDCGLLLFSEDNAAELVCRPVLDRLEELDWGYYR